MIVSVQQGTSNDCGGGDSLLDASPISLSLSACRAYIMPVSVCY